MVCGVCGTNDSRHGESVLSRAYCATNWVAEHLGASSRRPRHPFPALMAGATPDCVPVYTAQKRDPIKPRTAPVEQHNSDIDHLCSSTTATIALQLELDVVVVVGANNVNAAEPTIQHAKTPRLLSTGNNRQCIFQSSASRCPKQNHKTIRSETSTTTRHRDAYTPAAGQSADEEHEVTTVAVATMVQPFKGTVNDTTVGSASGAVNTKIPAVLPVRDWVCQIHTHTKATLGWQTQLVDVVLRVEHVEMCEILPKSLIN